MAKPFPCQAAGLLNPAATDEALAEDRKDHQFSLLEIAFATAATFGSEREDSVPAVGKYAENRNATSLALGHAAPDFGMTRPFTRPLLTDPMDGSVLNGPFVPHSSQSFQCTVCGAMAISPFNHAVLALTCTFMVMSTLSLSLMGLARKDATAAFNRIAVMVTSCASIAYFLMSMGMGVLEDENGMRVYWVRYVDWCFTTPLMLLELGVIAGADSWQTLLLIVIDELMLLFGIASSLSYSGKWPFFMLGLLSFAGVVLKLFFSLTSKAEKLGGEAEMLFKFVANRTAEIWCIYPVLFALCECTKTLPEEVEVAGYAIADVIAKCGIPMMVWVSTVTNSRKLGLGLIDEDHVAAAEDVEDHSEAMAAAYDPELVKSEIVSDPVVKSQIVADPAQ
ncbi:Sensory rhodopsin-2 [Symbiodinium microadriaticum]|uniref:Sensory rhodopsin-2 n=2 Tax=Symbiodinium TaxID=2949 RepID=A0A1Q9CKQ6_SYMMI|nr:Sensory rhodopsin-2 [Symbiodinium microadriaticum]